MQFVCITSQSSISRIDEKHFRDSIMVLGRIVPLIFTPPSFYYIIFQKDSILEKISLFDL